MIWLTDFYIPLISLENLSREKNAENKILTVQHFKLLITQLIIAFLDIFFPFSSFIWLFNISVTNKSITSYQKSAVSGVLLTMCESETKQNFIRTFPNRRDYKLLQAEIQNVSNNNQLRRCNKIFVLSEKKRRKPAGPECENEWENKKRAVAIKWSRKQILSLACKCIEHELSIFLSFSKCVVMRCCPKAFYVPSFSFYTLYSIAAWQSLCPPSFKRNGICLHSESGWVREGESIVRHLHNQIYDFTDNLFRHIKNNIIFIFLFSAFDFHWNIYYVMWVHMHSFDASICAC